MSFLSLDSKFMVLLSRAVDYIQLNLYCLICCIPIVTAGAAFTARYYVAMKIVRGEEPAITKAYFRAFRDNFKQATAVWLIIGGLILIYALDWRWTRLTQKNVPMQILFMVLCLLAVCMAYCAFPMLARFRMTVFGLIKSAFIFSIIHLPRVLLALVLEVVPLMMGYLYLNWFLVVWLLMAAAVLHLNSQMFVTQLKKLEPVEEQPEAAGIQAEEQPEAGDVQPEKLSADPEDKKVP
ncbi:MAG: YesL family protein [Lachnospiraceae bacterium]